MREHTIQRQIAESMKSGSARILDESLILDPEDLIEAVAVARAGGNADPVIHSMTQLVFRISETYMRKWASHLPDHASFDDVFMGGLEGLQKSITRFDPARGYAFTTYSTWWIRNGVQHVIYDLAGGGSIRAKALIAGVAPDDPLVGRALVSLDYQENDTDRPLHESVQDRAEEPFDVELVRSIYDLLSSVDSHLPAIVDLLHRDYAYREIARLVRLPIAEVKRLHEEGAAALEASGLVGRQIQAL